jgi:hypothetical protein
MIIRERIGRLTPAFADGRSICQAFEAVAMKKTDLWERIFLSVVGQAYVTSFGMGQAMYNFLICNDTRSNSGSMVK